MRRNKSNPKPKRNVYQEVTDTILEALDQEILPWQKPWSSKGGFTCPISGVTGKGYRGVNRLLLDLEGMHKGWDSPEFFTFNHAKKLATRDGERAPQILVKGSRGTPLVFYKFIDRKDEEGNRILDANGKPRQVGFARFFTVFNREQFIPGILPDSRYVTDEPREPLPEVKRIEAAAQILRALEADGCPLRRGGNRACYSPLLDEIRLPDVNAFRDPLSEAATALHEATHATGHESRLSRPGITKFDHFGSKTYAFEELVAEMGSAFLCASLDLPLGLDQHASYLKHWKEILKKDNRAIFRASSHAQKASDFLLSLAETVSVAA